MIPIVVAFAQKHRDVSGGNHPPRSVMKTRTETFLETEMKSKTGNATFTFFRPLKRQTPIQLAKNWSLRWIYSMYTRLFSPADSDERKYHISVCQIFKDEAPYLKEWIEYHLLIGIDHFFFYDNNSTDGYEKVIQPYIDRGIITLVKWPKKHSQVEAYEDCIRRFRKESDWIGFIDVDEFVVPVATKSFPEFLDKFSRKPAVLIYWRFFGSGGMIQRDLNRLVIEDFTVASEKLYSKGKCFYNTHYEYLWDSKLNKSMFHCLWTRIHGIPVPPVDCFGRFFLKDCPATRKPIPVQLNHYAVKSFMEHREKNKKGDVYYDRPTHGDSVFFGRDARCSVPDYQIYKYLAQLKVNMGQYPH